MPRRSKVELSNETIQELENQFFTFLSSLTPEESRKFFSEFLTNEEKMMIYKRLALYWALFEGYSLASIQKMLGVTHDTTRIYNKKKLQMSEDFKNMVARIGHGEGIHQQVPQQQEEHQEAEQEAQRAQELQEQHQEQEVPQEAQQPQEVHEEHAPSEDQENQETQENQEPQDSEEEPEKKKGFGRFFGF